MAICYDKLWKLLIDKKMNRTELKEASGISFNVLARLGKNEPVSFESIEKICFTLNCKIEDVVEIQKDEPIQIDSDAFTTIELFAGAGGLALGIEKAGFEPLGLIEFDKDAAESLKTNRPNWRVIHDDIANISCLDLEDYFGIKKGELDLSPEQMALLNDTYESMVRKGANLKGENREKYRKLTTELNQLTLTLRQNLLKATNSFEMLLTKPEELDGLPQSAIDAAALMAQNKGKKGFLFDLSYPSYGPFMQYSARRDLREKMYRAYNSRCQTGEFDNTQIVKVIYVPGKLLNVVVKPQ